jgi:hypothetical protein
MSTIGCNEFLNQLDRWMSGERHPDARAHVQGCDNCRGLVGDFEAIESAAPGLAVADPEPPARIWFALREQLEQEGLIRQDIGRAGAASWVPGLLTHIPRPALAGAYLCLLVTLAFGLSGPLATRTAQPLSFPFSTQLDSAEQTTFSSFAGSKSRVSATLHHNLAIVDNYIALCEKSVREEPNNSAAREYLYQAYQQKADLLALMTERGDWIQ